MQRFFIVSIPASAFVMDVGPVEVPGGSFSPTGRILSQFMTSLHDCEEQSPSSSQADIGKFYPKITEFMTLLDGFEDRARSNSQADIGNIYYPKITDFLTLLDDFDDRAPASGAASTKMAKFMALMHAFEEHDPSGLQDDIGTSYPRMTRFLLLLHDFEEQVPSGSLQDVRALLQDFAQEAPSVPHADIRATYPSTIEFMTLLHDFDDDADPSMKMPQFMTFLNYFDDYAASQADIAKFCPEMKKVMILLQDFEDHDPSFSQADMGTALGNIYPKMTEFLSLAHDFEAPKA